MSTTSHRSSTQQASLGQGGISGTGNDEVVVDRDTHQLAGLDQLPGDPDIFARRLRVAGRMIVQTDDGRGIFQDGATYASVNAILTFAEIGQLVIRSI